MKRATTIRRTDVILSVGTLALVLLAVAVMAATGTLDEFGAWAWERHHNVLSWYIRPLFLLPFCYFAYRRSLFGITITLVALATSMFWFPAPEIVRTFAAGGSSWLVPPAGLIYGNPGRRDGRCERDHQEAGDGNVPERGPLRPVRKRTGEPDDKDMSR